MTDREKGVATTECKQCGNELQLVTQRDGSVSPENCEECFPAPDGTEATSDTETASLGLDDATVVDVNQGENGADFVRETGTYNGGSDDV